MVMFFFLSPEVLEIAASSEQSEIYGLKQGLGKTVLHPKCQSKEKKCQW